MKKQFTILLLFLFICAFGVGQTRMKTDIPCSKELLLKTPGAWTGIGKEYLAKLTKPELQQVENRLNTIHQWVQAIYPSPMAFDAATGYSADDINFACQLKIEKLPEGRIRTSEFNGTPTVNYRYSTKFCSYHCGRNANEIMRGRGCETGSVVGVSFNSLTPLFIPKSNDDFYSEFMRIDERPIKMLSVVRQEKWKGYDVYSPETGSGDRFVLLYRNGILPYIPVTRKQYLERSIKCLEIFFDKNIKTYDEFGALMDKKTKDENIKKQQQQKDEVVKYYRDELESTTKAGLLDTPAIIPVTLAYPDPNVPIFTTSAAGGHMLVTENPAYFKKDIPKYIPQLIIVRMWNRGDGPDPVSNPYHLYYKDFPIEKLQAMIDK